jgi:hypothetical protein
MTGLLDRLKGLLMIAEREREKEKYAARIRERVPQRDWPQYGVDSSDAEPPQPDEWPTLANIDQHVAEHRYGRSVVLGKAPDEPLPPVRPYRPIRVILEERDQLYGYVQGLLGLLQLLRERADTSLEVTEIMRTNHRVADAEAYLTQIVPPREG